MSGGNGNDNDSGGDNDQDFSSDSNDGGSETEEVTVVPDYVERGFPTDRLKNSRSG